MVIVVLIFWAGVGGLIGYAIGNSKGRGTEGFWLGFFLGLIGWIIEAFQKPTGEVAARQEAASTVTKAQLREVRMHENRRPCPSCAELIQPAAKVCRFCGRDVPPVSQDEQLASVRAEHPAEYEKARTLYDDLGVKPDSPPDWLRELCRRIEAGSPPDVAVMNIPLDWKEQEPWTRQA